MKVVAILLSLLFTFNVMAGSVKSLESAMDEYHYTLTVEWDQRDQAFYNKQTDAFVSNLSKLIQEQGLTKEQVLALAEKKMNNSKAFSALKLKLSLLAPAASATELAETLREAAKDFYTAGASWNGEAVFTYAIIGLMVLAIGYSIWFHATHECVRYESVYSCDTDSYCVSSTYDWETGDRYCDWWEEETTCGYSDVCREWQKKK